jgi:apolipoprotein N-acyltransferase
VGRKNSYGWGAVWAGRLAAILLSLLPTLCLWDRNPRSWLTAYWSACAESGGGASEAVHGLLPWNLSEQQRQRGSLEDEDGNTDTS